MIKIEKYRLKNKDESRSKTFYELRKWNILKFLPSCIKLNKLGSSEQDFNDICKYELVLTTITYIITK